MGTVAYRLALLLIMLGTAIVLMVSIDPLIGIGIVMLIAGTSLLREV
jgi:hypothetical protein